MMKDHLYENINRMRLLTVIWRIESHSCQEEFENYGDFLQALVFFNVIFYQFATR